MTARTVLTIGNFDGVHRGHQALLRRAREIAGPAVDGGRVIALVFCPHPMSTLRPNAAPATLMPFERRTEIMVGLGVDEVVRLEPTPEFLGRTAETFIRDLVEHYDPVAFVEGEDFHFGRAREGNVTRLRELADEFGTDGDPRFDVDIVTPQTIDLYDQSVVVASSSIARWLVRNGRIADAARVLGRPYELSGRCVRGDRRGRDLGFPTANLQTEALLPADGVYAGVAILPDGRRRIAALHVGARATFDDATRTVEGHILDWEGPLAEGTAEYGWPLRYEFVRWLRGQVGFESIELLVEQINKDVERTREAVERSRFGARVGRITENAS